MRKRRSRAALEDAVDRAASARGRAIALYQLALFHDNNSRETEAIPFYEAAIKNGLPTPLKAQALAWLASSLYKTGRRQHALTRIRQSREIARSRGLRKFLDSLETRIARSHQRNP
jgi:tetratricopeptide (TPR) repeat protein